MDLLFETSTGPGWAWLGRVWRGRGCWRHWPAIYVGAGSAGSAGIATGRGPRAAHCEQSSTTADDDAVVFNATDTTISFPYFCSVLFCFGNKKRTYRFLKPRAEFFYV